MAFGAAWCEFTRLFSCQTLGTFNKVKSDKKMKIVAELVCEEGERCHWQHRTKVLGLQRA